MPSTDCIINIVLSAEISAAKRHSPDILEDLEENDTEIKYSVTTRDNVKGPVEASTLI